MEYREFGNTGIKTSLLGFGCMRFPTKLDSNGKNIIDEEETEKMLDYAYKNGVTYYDTAYPYNGGQSEVVLGRIMKKYKRDSFYVATKLPVWLIEDKSQVRNIFEEQLKKLQIDYVDFYLLHALNKNTFQKVKDLNILDEVLKLKEEGKIKHIGFSFHDDFKVFEEIINYYDNWEFCQIQFNYMDSDIQAGLKGIKLTEEKHIPLVIMEPIKGGNLSSFSKEVENIFLSYNDKFTIASWALRYVGSFDNVKVILSGMSSFNQVKDNISTFANFKKLNEEEMKIIEDAKTLIKSKIKIGCTGCKYCMPCPVGVNIPLNFSLWNNYAMYNNESFKTRYHSLLDNEKASACLKCGRCETLCPQHLKIRDNLKLLSEELK